jgi:hypothetical protein
MNEIAKQTKSATAEDWARFFKPCLLAFGNPPADAEFRARMVAIAFAMDDVRADMLTPFRQREAARRFKFLPLPAEIAEWLAPDLAERRRTMAAIAAAASSAPRISADQPAPRTDEARAAARDKVAMIRAAIINDLTRGEVKRVRRAPVDDDALIETYERMAKEGNRAAATRAASLRRKMGVEE